MLWSTQPSKRALQQLPALSGNRNIWNRQQLHYCRRLMIIRFVTKRDFFPLVLLIHRGCLASSPQSCRKAAATKGSGHCSKISVIILLSTAGFTLCMSSKLQDKAHALLHNLQHLLAKLITIQVHGTSTASQSLQLKFVHRLQCNLVNLFA